MPLSSSALTKFSASGCARYHQKCASFLKMNGSESMSIAGTTWFRFDADTTVKPIVPLRTLCTLATASPSCVL